MSRYKLEVMLSEELLARLDAAREFEPRASFARRALEAALGGSSTGEQPPGSSGFSQVAGSTPARPASPRAPEPESKPYELPKIAKRKA
jgi:hypothetical protein